MPRTLLASCVERSSGSSTGRYSRVLAVATSVNVVSGSCISGFSRLCRAWDSVSEGLMLVRCIGRIHRETNLGRKGWEPLFKEFTVILEMVAKTWNKSARVLN